MESDVSEAAAGHSAGGGGQQQQQAAGVEDIRARLERIKQSVAF